MDSEPIISVQKAREFQGDIAIDMSDETITDVLSTLDLLAKGALATARKQIQSDKDPRARFGKSSSNA